MTAVAAAINIIPYYYSVFFYIVNFLRDGRRKLNSYHFCSWNDCICGGSVSAFAVANKR